MSLCMTDPEWKGAVAEFLEDDAEPECEHRIPAFYGDVICMDCGEPWEKGDHP